MKSPGLRFLFLSVLLGAAAAGGWVLGARRFPPPPAPPGPRDWPVLTVRVTDPEGRGIRGARVSIERYGRLRIVPAGGGPTGASGRAIYHLPPARYRLTVTRRGLSTARVEADLRAGGDRAVSAVLEPALTLEGRILAPGGVPREGVVVRIRWREGERRVRTDAGGRWSAPGVPYAAGRVWIVDATAPPGRWRPPDQVRRVTGGAPGAGIRVPDIRLLPAASVRGRLESSRLEGTAVYLTNRWSRNPLVDRPGEVWFATVRPDREGRFQAGGVAPGRVEVYAVRDGAPLLAAAVDLAPGESRDLGSIRVAERADGAVAGRLRWIRNQPAGGGVRLITDLAMRRVAPDGSFRIGGLIGERVTLLGGVRYEEHYLPFRRTVEVGAEDLLLAPSPRRRLRLAFTDAETGEPVKGRPAAVAVDDPPGEGSGFYYIHEALWTEPLIPGTPAVTVRVRGYRPVRLPRVRVEPYRETRLAVRVRP